MTSDELAAPLDLLIAGRVTEVVELKSALSSADKADEYVSALANEANLCVLTSGWVVLGDDNHRQIAGNLE